MTKIDNLENELFYAIYQQKGRITFESLSAKL